MYNHIKSYWLVIEISQGMSYNSYLFTGWAVLDLAIFFGDFSLEFWLVDGLLSFELIYFWEIWQGFSLNILYYVHAIEMFNFSEFIHCFSLLLFLLFTKIYILFICIGIYFFAFSRCFRFLDFLAMTFFSMVSEWKRSFYLEMFALWKVERFYFFCSWLRMAYFNLEIFLIFFQRIHFLFFIIFLIILLFHLRLS